MDWFGLAEGQEVNLEINLEKYATIEGLGAQSRGDPGRWLFWGRNKDGQTSQEAFVVLRWPSNGLNLRVGTGTASFSYIPVLALHLACGQHSMYAGGRKG